jgi:hypothetical protein
MNLPSAKAEGRFIQLFALQHILKSLLKISSIRRKNIPLRHIKQDLIHNLKK